MGEFLGLEFAAVAVYLASVHVVTLAGHSHLEGIDSQPGFHPRADRIPHDATRVGVFDRAKVQLALIYAIEYHDDYTKKSLIVTASVCALFIITFGVLIGLLVVKGFAVVYSIGAIFGAVSFVRPSWLMRRG